MKKTTSTEERAAAFQTFFDEMPVSTGEIVVNKSADLLYEYPSEAKNPVFLDYFLDALKLTFIYLPGVAVLNSIVFGLILFAYVEEFTVEMFLGLLGFFAAGTFMTMFGIGKMSDLKYLKVPAVVFLTSIPLAILLQMADVFGVDGYFGIFLLLIWFCSAALGFFVKRHIDSGID